MLGFTLLLCGRVGVEARDSGEGVSVRGGRYFRGAKGDFVSRMALAAGLCWWMLGTPGR
ncbi:hypothetical protein Mal65_28340 [Crateriforma conspicua]|nr:hypothetical protein Mal65_28340 [Crateriforma conspicua]